MKSRMCQSGVDSVGHQTTTMGLNLFGVFGGPIFVDHVSNQRSYAQKLLWKTSRGLWFEPRAAGFEAQTLPPCDPPVKKHPLGFFADLLHFLTFHLGPQNDENDEMQWLASLHFHLKIKPSLRRLDKKYEGDIKAKSFKDISLQGRAWSGIKWIMNNFL